MWSGEVRWAQARAFEPERGELPGLSARGKGGGVGLSAGHRDALAALSARRGSGHLLGHVSRCWAAVLGFAGREGKRSWAGSPGLMKWATSGKGSRPGWVGCWAA